MKAKAMITLLVGAAMIWTTPLVTLGAPGGGQGPPSGVGGGGSNAGDAAGALYGDLYVTERDGAGVPITREVTYPDPETGQDVTVECSQPLAVGCGLLPLWGECGSTTLPGVLPLPACTFDPELYDPCAVYSGDPPYDYDEQVQTVSFGRGSVSRSPASVIDSSYAEALKAINLAVPASCGDAATSALAKDPAGRIMLCLAADTDPVSYAWKTIDSPLENLGLYRAAMTDGCFGPIDEVVVGEEGQTITVTTELSDTAKSNLAVASLGHLVCADYTLLPEVKTKADMLSAAVFIGAAADKFYPVTLDQIINLNTSLGVNTYTYVRQQKNRILTVTYFPFTVDGVWFTYDLGVDACVSPTYANLLVANGGFFQSQTIDVFGATPPGVDLRGDNGVPITVCQGGLPLSEVCDDPDTNTVYGPDIDDIGCGGANWFAQAAEDARKTIWYLHNWEAPEIAY